MNAKQFFDEVSKLRKLQKEYFRTKSPSVLRDCKRLEKQIDDEIERVNKLLDQRQQPGLFNQNT